MGDLAIDEKVLSVRTASDSLLPRTSLLLRSLLLCATYYLGVVLGFHFIFPDSYVSVMWLPNTFLLVALLLSAGANRSARNRDRATAADYAERGGHEEIVALLRSR